MKVRLRCVDVETTGLAPPEEICELGWTDLEFDAVTKAVTISAPASLLFKPTRPITPETQAIHHITPAMVEGLSPCGESDIRALLSEEPYALVAHNRDFELKWLTPEILGPQRWIDTYKTALRLWPDAPGHGNQVLRYWLKLPLIADLAQPAHRAGPDTYVTAFILAEQLKLASVSDLNRWTREPRYFARCPLGRHKGQRWEDIPADYLTWIVGPKATEVEEAVKHAARQEQQRRRDAAPQT